jgi:hypothetical protein
MILFGSSDPELLELNLFIAGNGYYTVKREKTRTPQATPVTEQCYSYTLLGGGACTYPVLQNMVSCSYIGEKMHTSKSQRGSLLRNVDGHDVDGILSETAVV